MAGCVLFFYVFSCFFHWAVGFKNLGHTEKLFQRAYVLLHFHFLATPCGCCWLYSFQLKGGILFCFKLVGYIMMKYLLVST